MEILRNTTTQADWSEACTLVDVSATTVKWTIANASGARDLDYETALIVRGGPTYAALTARSYHPGGVNVLLGDGSVRFVKTTVNGATWRALGTVAGSEVVSAESL